MVPDDNLLSVPAAILAPMEAVQIIAASLVAIVTVIVFVQHQLERRRTRREKDEYRRWLTRRRHQLLAGECRPVEDHELVHAAQAVAEGCLAWAPGGRALDLPSQDSEVTGETLRLRYCARLLATSEPPSRGRDRGLYFIARERFESDLVASVVEKHAGNTEKAARELGIGLSTTKEKLQAAC
jgi:hypothetical protein